MRKFRIEIEQVNLPVGTESYKEQNGSILFRGKDGNIEAFLIPEVLSHPNIFKAITDNHDEEFQSVWKEFCTIHKCDVWNEIVYMDGAKKIFNHALTLSKERECVEVFRWLLGYSVFPERQQGDGAYWWRKQLSEKLKAIGIYDEVCADPKIVEEKKEESENFCGRPIREVLFGSTAKREQAIGELVEFIEREMAFVTDKESKELQRLITAVKEVK